MAQDPNHLGMLAPRAVTAPVPSAAPAPAPALTTLGLARAATPDQLTAISQSSPVQPMLGGAGAPAPALAPVGGVGMQQPALGALAPAGQPSVPLLDGLRNWAGPGAMGIIDNAKANAQAGNYGAALGGAVVGGGDAAAHIIARPFVDIAKNTGSELGGIGMGIAHGIHSLVQGVTGMTPQQIAAANAPAVPSPQAATDMGGPKPVASTIPTPAGSPTVAQLAFGGPAPVPVTTTAPVAAPVTISAGGAPMATPEQIALNQRLDAHPAAGLPAAAPAGPGMLPLGQVPGIASARAAPALSSLYAQLPDGGTGMIPGLRSMVSHVQSSPEQLAYDKKMGMEPGYTARAIALQPPGKALAAGAALPAMFSGGVDASNEQALQDADRKLYDQSQGPKREGESEDAYSQRVTAGLTRYSKVLVLRGKGGKDALQAQEQYLGAGQ